MEGFDLDLQEVAVVADWLVQVVLEVVEGADEDFDLEVVEEADSAALEVLVGAFSEVLEWEAPK